MKRRLLALLLTPPGCLLASYTYYYTDSLTSINTTNWYQNGSLTATSGGLTAPTINGGALISKLAVPDGSANYEIKSTLTLPVSGGTYVQLLRATSNAVSDLRPPVRTMLSNSRIPPGLVATARQRWPCTSG